MRSVPDEYGTYQEIIESTFLRKGDIGYLTIDESPVVAGKPHRGARAKYGRAIHTEAGLVHQIAAWGVRTPAWGVSVPAWGDARVPAWGGVAPGWGGRVAVTLDRDVKILLANNLDGSCALWDAEHPNTSSDGDIGYAADDYPYESATFMKSGDVHEIGIFTPHESLPVTRDFNRQFLRIVSSGVHGREPYFTRNPLMEGSNATPH
jgi:hypothetical protein